MDQNGSKVTFARTNLQTEIFKVIYKQTKNTSTVCVYLWETGRGGRVWGQGFWFL